MMMTKTNAKALFCSAALALMALATSLNPAMAQVVNSNPSSSSANSQVTLTASVPSVVIVRVNAGTSTLSYTLNPNLIDSSSNVSSQDFAIRGNVIVNSPSANVQCSLSSTTLSLVNGSDTLTTRLTGTIGGTNISTSGFTPTFSSRQAAIVINGDLDESTATSAKAPGTYSGTVTITASLI